MKVFVTGATGYIGSAICDALLAAGHTPLGLARSDISAERLTKRGIAPYFGDLKDSESLLDGVFQSDAVIHVGTTNDKDSASADIESVSTMLGALQDTGKTFIYTSGVWIYGNTGNEIITELTPLRPIPLVRWRPLVEEHVLMANQDGTCGMVIRPAIVYGRGGGLPAMFRESARDDGAARYIGDGENHWPLVHVDALAQLYVAALERGQPSSTWLAAHGPAIKVIDIAKAASEGAGASGKTISWPLEDARATLGPLADALVLDQQASGEDARTSFQWEPKVPNLLDDLRNGSYTVAR